MSSKLLVTGGASGIGRRISTYFHEEGWTVTAHYHSSDRAAKTLPEGIHTTQADLTTPSGCDRLVELYNRHADRLDLLVNNAALYRRTDPADFDVADWDDQMALNARAPYQISARCARELLDEGGSVINITDARHRRSSTDHIPYSASKAALENVTRSLARTLGPEIRVNAVAPGPIDFPEDYSEEEEAQIVEGTVLGRSGRPDEIARAVHFLASGATYTTGTTLEVDGGQHLS